MTKREELIEAAARAISKVSGWPEAMWDDPTAYSTPNIAKAAYIAFATVALDAILAGMREPDKVMQEAAGRVEGCGCPCCYGADDWQVMLDTLSPPPALV